MSRRVETGAEERLALALRELQVPDADGAERRSLAVVRAAARSAEQGGSASSGRSMAFRGSRRRLAQIAVAVGLLAVIVSPAGAAVRDWVHDAVQRTTPPALPALTSLPAQGNLLVDSSHGPWVVHADGSKRLLGDYEAAGWSPHGLYVAATSGRELAAIEPDGDVRWTLARGGPVTDPTWSPDGYRIAYREGSDLRMVAGDGTGDRRLAEGVAPVPPAWRPRGARVLSFAAADGSVRTVRADTGARIFTIPVGSARGEGSDPTPRSLYWSADGSRLLVARESSLEAFTPNGRLAWREVAPPGTVISDAAIAPGGSYAAVVLRSRGEPRGALRLLGPGGPARPLFEGPGRLGQVEFSPDGHWLLLTWPSADQWLFLDPSRPGMTVAISDIAAQFSPGATSPSAFPRLSGWCCPTVP